MLKLGLDEEGGAAVAAVDVFFVHGGVVFERVVAAVEDDGRELADLGVGVVGVVDVCGGLSRRRAGLVGVFDFGEKGRKEVMRVCIKYTESIRVDSPSHPSAAASAQDSATPPR